MIPVTVAPYHVVSFVLVAFVDLVVGMVCLVEVVVLMQIGCCLQMQLQLNSVEIVFCVFSLMLSVQSQ